MKFLRSMLFYIGYASATILWGALSVLVAWILPFRQRFSFIVSNWSRFSLWWLKITCGIHHEIEGLEHLPVDACVISAHHESTWETIFLQTLVAPQATLIKRELLWIPFFGWAFALLKPIAINRGSPRNSLKQLIREGRLRLDQGIFVVLFPEGTRMPPGQIGKFQVGGAALASAAGAQIVVVAHNAGTFWPAHRFLKKPGTIKVAISAPIPGGEIDSKSLLQNTRKVMQDLMAGLDT